jgi:hypothetical protein
MRRDDGADGSSWRVCVQALWTLSNVASVMPQLLLAWLDLPRLVIHFVNCRQVP